MEGQLWYVSHFTDTIRTTCNDFCLEILSDDTLAVDSFKGDNLSQKWRLDGEFLVNQGNRTLVLDLKDGDTGDGAVVVSAKKDEESQTQRWYYEHQPCRVGYIISKKNGKVLDISKNSAEPGADVIIFARKEDLCANQLWYADKNGILRSHLNNFALESNKEGFVKMFEFEPENPQQEWMFSGEFIRNGQNPERGLDFFKERSANGTQIIAYQIHGGDNQRWKMVYV